MTHETLHPDRLNFHGVTVRENEYCRGERVLWTGGSPLGPYCDICGKPECAAQHETTHAYEGAGRIALIDGNGLHVLDADQAWALLHGGRTALMDVIDDMGLDPDAPWDITVTTSRGRKS